MLDAAERGELIDAPPLAASSNKEMSNDFVIDHVTAEKWPKIRAAFPSLLTAEQLADADHRLPRARPRSGSSDDLDVPALMCLCLEMRLFGGDIGVA